MTIGLISTHNRVGNSQNETLCFDWSHPGEILLEEFKALNVSYKVFL